MLGQQYMYVGLASYIMFYKVICELLGEHELGSRASLRDDVIMFTGFSKFGKVTAFCTRVPCAHWFMGHMLRR